MADTVSMWKDPTSPNPHEFWTEEAKNTAAILRLTWLRQAEDLIEAARILREMGR